MKKLFALMLVLLLMVSLSACDSQKLKMEKIIEANQVSKLLETYDSVYSHGTMNGELYKDYYFSKTESFEKNADEAIYLTDDTGYACRNGNYERVLIIAKDGLYSYADYRAKKYEDAIMSDSALIEKVKSVTEAEDKLTVEIDISKKDLEQLVGEGNLSSFEAAYVLDAKNYSMISAHGVLECKDGTKIEDDTKYTYNAEIPEDAKPFIELANQTEDLRSLTLVFNAGTDKEKTEVIKAPKGLPVAMYLPSNDAELFELYTDAEFTVKFQSNGDYTSDVTLYIK